MDIEFSYQKSGGWREVEEGVQIDGPLWACQIQHEGLEASAVSLTGEIEALETALLVLKGEGPYPPSKIVQPIELTEDDEKWWRERLRSKYDVVSVVYGFHNNDGTMSTFEI